MSVVEDLVLAFQTRGTREAIADTEHVSRAIKHTDETAQKATKSHAGLGKSFAGLGGLARNAAGVIGVGGLAFGIAEAAKKAEAFQESQAQLGASIHANVRRPARDAAHQMGEFADSMSTRGGFDPTESIQGMTQFLRVTHDVGKAQADTTLATNISRGAHVSLSRAVRAVTMLEQGRTTGLSKLGIVVPKVTAAVDALHEAHKKATPQQLAAAKATDALATKQRAMANVTHQYSGAMTTYSHTAAGSMANMRNAVDVLAERLGSVLLPWVTKITTAVSGFVREMISGKSAGGQLVSVLKTAAHWLEATWQWIKRNKEWLEFLAAAVGGMVVAYKAWKIATEAVKAAQIALNAVSDMNPWVLAIGAVIAIVVLMYVKFRWFRDFAKGALHVVAAAFHWLKQAVSDVFNWIKSHWPLLVGILTGPVGLAIVEIVKHFDTIKKIPGQILHAFKSVGGAIAKAIAWPFMWAFNWVKHHLPHFHTVHVGPIGIPIPSFQSGGPVTSSGPVLVGERGPEVVTLPRGSYVHPHEAKHDDRPIVIYNMLDGKVMSQAIIRQGLLQTARGG